MRIGSQWWCLRRSTVNAVLNAVSERPQLVRFFKTTWIPDETFFQSLVYDLVPRREIVSESPTFLMFSDYGMPVTFYNDHYDYLLGQPQMFARKISGEATDLKTALNALYPRTDLDIDISGEGRGLYAFVTGKGRIGRRFGARFWERDGDRAADRTLYIVACKKWHVARRFLDTVSVVSNMPALDYVFDEEGAQVPDLGGIESTLEKRRRHRRAVVGLLFDHFGSDSMVICIDPSNLDLMRDFYSDRSDVRLLSIECAFSDAYLDGHARRVGILSDRSPASVARRVIPTVRNDIASEIVAIRDARFPSFYRVAEDADPADNAAAIAGFLSITPDMARQISDVPHLFAD